MLFSLVSLGIAGLLAYSIFDGPKSVFDGFAYVFYGGSGAVAASLGLAFAKMADGQTPAPPTRFFLPLAMLLLNIGLTVLAFVMGT
jgi:hypothetical protein